MFITVLCITCLCTCITHHFSIVKTFVWLYLIKWIVTSPLMTGCFFYAIFKANPLIRLVGSRSLFIAFIHCHLNVGQSAVQSISLIYNTQVCWCKLGGDWCVQFESWFDLNKNLGTCFLLTEITWTSFLFSTWLRQCIDLEIWNVVIRLCPNFNGSLAKIPLRLGHEWVIISSKSYGMWLCIHAVMSAMTPCVLTTLMHR